MTVSFLSGLFEPFGGALGIITALIALLVGSLSLFFGRRLYWLFVGVIGFILGLTVGPMLFNNLNPTWQLILTLVIAGVFSLLAVALSKFMVPLAGAIGLGWLVYLLAYSRLEQWAVVLLTVISAIIGVLVAWFFFDWGLMIFSSLSGAILTTRGLLSLIPSMANFVAIIFLVLLILGLIVQISAWVRGKKTQAPATADA